MSEPTTVTKGFIVPLTGDLAGTWGDQAVNPNFTALDGILGGYASVSLSSVNVTLTVPSGYSATPGGGPTQSQNALISLIGALSNNVRVTFPMPGFYLVENLCSGNFYIHLATSSPGNLICAIPGEMIQIFCDGVNMHYVGLGRPGSYIDIATTTVPSWITNCTVPPYLNCDGSSFSSGTYPVLTSLLGGTTLPDLRGRSRAALNQGTNRITSGGSGINGDALLAAGGEQTHTLTTPELASHSHGVTDPGHHHSFSTSPPASATGGGSQVLVGPSNFDTSTNFTGISIQSTGNGAAHNNMQPTTIAGLTLIRAA